MAVGNGPAETWGARDSLAARIGQPEPHGTSGHWRIGRALTAPGRSCRAGGLPYSVPADSSRLSIRSSSRVSTDWLM